MHRRGPIYVVGDVHGHVAQLVRLLQAAKLIGDDRSWTGGAATVWFLGDYFDRGPDGIAVVDLIMALQEAALRVGGQVHALLGNHEVLLLAAHHFGDQRSGGPGGTFRADWLCNGGQVTDLARLTTRHRTWLTHLPAMAHLDDWLLVHADATLYTHYGSSVAAVNQVVGTLLRSADVTAWDRLLGEFSERQAFADGQLGGAARLAQFLGTFGSQRLIHGHTPISSVCDRPPATVTEAVVYADGRCVNVDSGIYLGGPGFVYQLGT